MKDFNVSVDWKTENWILENKNGYSSYSAFIRAVLDRMRKVDDFRNEMWHFMFQLHKRRDEFKKLKEDIKIDEFIEQTEWDLLDLEKMFYDEIHDENNDFKRIEKEWELFDMAIEKAFRCIVIARFFHDSVMEHNR